MSEFPLGIDMSSWQYSSDGKRKPNFDIINAKCDFVAVRATISWGYQDKWFNFSWDNLTVPRMAYSVIYPGESAQRHISIRGTDSNRYSEIRMSWEETNDTFEIVIWDSRRYTVQLKWNGTPTTGTWYFIVGWHDPNANTLNIQVNNGTPTTRSHSYGIYDGSLSSTRQIKIGALVGYYQYMDGLMDEVSVWKRVLTADERTWLYNNGNGRTYEDLFYTGKNYIRWFV